MIEEISIPTTKEIEADGFITPQSALEYKGKATGFTANPMSECLYPKCEDCDHYHGHYCTVPMVVSKQIWCETAERIVKIEKTLAEIESLVTDEILGSDKIPKINPVSHRTINAERRNEILDI